MVLDPTLSFVLIGSVGTAGVTWGVFRGRFVDMRNAFNAHIKADERHQLETVDRLARIETKLDMALRRR